MRTAIPLVRSSTPTCASRARHVHAHEEKDMRRNLVIAPLAALLITAIVAGPASATYPDRNGRLVFQADNGSGYQLYTVKANGHDLQQVTHVTNSDAVLADWSPDGRQIVYEH